LTEYKYREDIQSIVAKSSIFIIFDKVLFFPA